MIFAIIVLIVYLFIQSKLLLKKNLLIIVILFILYIDFLYINISSVDGIVTSSSVMLTLVFAYTLSWAVETNSKIKIKLNQFYRAIFFVFPICSVLSIIYYIALGEFALFPSYSSDYLYLYTPFGVLLEKNILGFNIYRSFFYFIEPVYIALFYAANIVLVPQDSKGKFNYFLLANLIGGILSFSFLFYFFVILFIIIQKKTTRNSFWKKIFFITLTIYLYQSTDIFLDSSADDRLYRINNFFEIAKNFSFFQFMFGHGFYSDTSFNESFSAGLFTSIYEIGLLNLIMIFYFYYLLSNGKKYMLILFFISLLAFEPIKLPLFWLLIVLLSNSSIDQDEVKCASI